MSVVDPTSTRAPHALTEELPSALVVLGSPVPINTSHRYGIQSLIALDQLGENAAPYLVEYLFGDNISDREGWIEEAWAATRWFLNRGQAVRRQRKSRRVFCWEHDQDAIIADFSRYYGVDLVTCPAMHWWAFKMRFDNLPPESECKTRMFHRGPAPKGSSSEQKSEHARISKIYRLPASRGDDS